MSAQSATITAENTFTAAIQFVGAATLSLHGISDSTVTLQYSANGGSTWDDVESYTADTIKTVENHDFAVHFRVGVKTGGYGTDTIAARIATEL